MSADREAILEKLGAPLSIWNFKGADPNIRMLGPTSQDFDTAFGLGAVGNTIASGNLHGVALAAIQGLNAKLEAELAEKDKEIDELRQAVNLLLHR